MRGNTREPAAQKQLDWADPELWRFRQTVVRAENVLTAVLTVLAVLLALAWTFGGGGKRTQAALIGCGISAAAAVLSLLPSTPRKRAERWVARQLYKRSKQKKR